MQENNNKNKLIIAGVVFSVLILSALYFIFFNNNTPTTTQTNTTENKPIFPEFSFKNIFSNENTSTDATNTENTTNSGNVDQLTKVWGGKSLGAGILDNGDILFLDISGEIRRSSSPYSSSNVVSNTRGNCVSAKFSNSGKHALVLCMDGLYLWGDSRFTAVDSNAFDYAFIGSGEDFVYISDTKDGFVSYTSLGGKISQVGGLHIHEVSILSADTNYIYISEKPNGRSQKLFVYSFKNKDFYYVGDLAVDNIGQFQKGYVKEKCSVYNQNMNICFGQNFSTFDFTNWRKGLSNSVDSVVVYSFEASKYIISGSLSENVDSYLVGVNATSTSAYLISKDNQNLFITNITQYLEIPNE